MGWVNILVRMPLDGFPRVKWVLSTDTFYIQLWAKMIRTLIFSPAKMVLSKDYRIPKMCHSCSFKWGKTLHISQQQLNAANV